MMEVKQTRLYREKRPCLEFSFAEYVRALYIYERIYGLIISNLRHSAPWYQRQHARVTLLDRFQRACTLVRVRVYVHDKGNEGNEGKERRSSRKRVYSLG